MWEEARDALPGGPGAAQARGCPSCGAGPLTRVEDCESVHWLCRSCGRCWQLGAASLHAVDPIACPGCASQDKEACFEIMLAGFPRFGGDATAD